MANSVISNDNNTLSLLSDNLSTQYWHNSQKTFTPPLIRQIISSNANTKKLINIPKFFSLEFTASHRGVFFYPCSHKYWMFQPISFHYCSVDWVLCAPPLLILGHVSNVMLKTAIHISVRHSGLEQSPPTTGIGKSIYFTTATKERTIC